MPQTVQLDGESLKAGLKWACEKTDEPILCLLKGSTLKLAFMGGLRLAISWQVRRSPWETGDAFLVIPNMIATKLLAMGAANAAGQPWRLSVDNMHIALHADDNKTLEWISDARKLGAPPQFGEMVVPPPGLLEVDYLTFSDALHRSVAELVERDAQETIHRSKLAILVDLTQGNLVVNGTVITRSRMERFYFDPRLIIRSLEHVQGPRIGLAIKRLGVGNRGILYVVSPEPERLICCGLLSISLETQKLYPLPRRDSA